MLFKLHPNCEIHIIVTECSWFLRLRLITILLNDLRPESDGCDLAGGKICICWHRELWRLWGAQPDSFISFFFSFISLTRPSTQDQRCRSQAKATFLCLSGKQSCLVHGQSRHLSQLSGNPGSLGACLGVLMGGGDSRQGSPLSCNSPGCMCVHTYVFVCIHIYNMHTPPHSSSSLLSIDISVSSKSLLNRSLCGFKSNQSRSWVKTELPFMLSKRRHTYKLPFYSSFRRLLCLSRGPQHSLDIPDI